MGGGSSWESGLKLKVYKDNTEQATQRVEAWWNHAVIDRAVIQVTAPRDTGRQRGGEHIDDFERYLTDPELVIPRAERELANTYFGGEAFPTVRPFDPVAVMASFLGCPLRFVSGSRTVWTEPIIDDPADLPALTYDAGNKWWLIARELMERFAERAEGYHLSMLDLNGPTEILARMRGTQKYALDFVTNPSYIKPAIDRITHTWHRYWRECVKIIQPTGGYFHWMGIWSDRPSVDLQSDFSCMISPRMFNQYFLPSLERQTRLIERTMYHLDGPAAVVHLDALLELPGLDGIQWVAGAGAKPTVEWIPLLKRIQAGGKLIYTDCRPEEVETLLRELRPEGLMLVTACDSEQQARELLRNVGQWTAM